MKFIVSSIVSFITVIAIILTLLLQVQYTDASNDDNNNNNEIDELIVSEYDSKKGGRKKHQERPKGNGGGDPHFRTYDGTQYNFHGQCDLVMAYSKSFGNGLGINIHARTDMRNGGTWSLIESAAVQIGTDIFELNNDGLYYINGMTNITLPYNIATNYTVSIDIIDLQGTIETFYHINLNDNDNGEIIISLFKDMISIRVEGQLDGTGGMLGRQDYYSVGNNGSTTSSSSSSLIGRDGSTVVSTELDMGIEWQVIDTEPKLFHNKNKVPQYPQKCILPSVTAEASRRRRLHGIGLGASHTVQVATEYCSNDIPIELQRFCIEDILITGDYDMAKHYHGYSF